MADEDENAEPDEPNAEDCCGQGCTSCVWDTYRENLKKYQAKQEDQMQSLDCGLSKLDFQTCTLIDTRVLTDDTAVYRLKTKGVIKILPGQHIELSIFDSKDVVRKYSPISWDRMSIDILIKRYKEGTMSKFFENLEIGAEILCRGPYGNFSHKRERQDFLLILSIGTGIAPMLSIIRSIVNDEEDETVIKLLCGCSNLENRYLLKELKDLASFWNFSFVHFVNSQEGEIQWGEKVERRHILEADVKNALPVPQKSFVLICGTDKFCDDMKKIVKDVGASFYCF